MRPRDVLLCNDLLLLGEADPGSSSIENDVLRLEEDVTQDVDAEACRRLNTIGMC